MERYEYMNEVGGGAFGSVFRAVDRQTGEFVAIKRLHERYYSWDDCLTLNEVKALLKLERHPNVVKLEQLIRQNNVLYLVFEYMDCTLFQVLKQRKDVPFSEAEIKKLCFQIFHAVAYMHQSGYFHRDLKPENLLIKNGLIKVADLGSAMEIKTKSPCAEYGTTLCYRAPELLLLSKYNYKVDMWAMGVIMAELFIGCRLFPAKCEEDMLYRICNVIGSPPKNNTWSKNGISLPKSAGLGLHRLIPYASVEAIDLIRSLCSWDPKKRPTAIEALQHPFFRGCFYALPSLPLLTPVLKTKTQSEFSTERKVLEEQDDVYREGVKSMNSRGAWRTKILLYFLCHRIK